MSYDLHLFRPREDLSPKLAVEELLSEKTGRVLRRILASKEPTAQRHADLAVRDDPARAERREKGRAESARLCEALRSHAPKLRNDEAGGRRGGGANGKIALTDPDSGIRFSFEVEHVQVAVPLALSGSKARLAFVELGGLIEQLEREGGFQTYDPQLERVLRFSEDLDAVLTSFARGAETMRAPILPKRKWWQRWKSR